MNCNYSVFKGVIQFILPFLFLKIGEFAFYNPDFMVKSKI